MRALALLSCLAVAGCSHTMGQAPLNDGKQLSVDGYGTKSQVSVKCLTPVEIKQLTGSEIDPTVTQASCYWVVFVSSDSSAISKAITAYSAAQDELQSKVTTALTGGTTNPTGPGADVAKVIVSSAVETDATSVAASAKKLGDTLDPTLRLQVAADLTDVAAHTANPEQKKKIDAAIQGLK